MPQNNSTISHHLKGLRLAVQITAERRGKHMICGVYQDAVDELVTYLRVDIEMSHVSIHWNWEHTSSENKGGSEICQKYPSQYRRIVGTSLSWFADLKHTEYLFENVSEGYLGQFTAGGKHDAGADIIGFGHTHVPYHRVVSGLSL